jgi:hypothetical protein
LIQEVRQSPQNQGGRQSIMMSYNNTIQAVLFHEEKPGRVKNKKINDINENKKHLTAREDSRLN